MSAGKKNQKSEQSSLSESTTEYITVYIEDQMFGIPVLSVHDVFMPQRVTSVPMALPEVGGVLNLRGRIVTVIDVRQRLGLSRRPTGATGMAVGVEYKGESYGLVIDSVGEVLQLKDADLERNPSNLDPRWCLVSMGVQRLENALMVVLDVSRLLDLANRAAAA